MKNNGFGRQVFVVFLVAVVAYAVAFGFIQHRRVVKGPWLVTFTVDSGTPTVLVNQPALGIKDVRIVFVDEHNRTNSTPTVDFSEPHATPFEVPFGQCIFYDPLFLPGTVTLQMFDHEIQLLPRVLTVDKMERSWQSGERIELRKIKAL